MAWDASWETTSWPRRISSTVSPPVPQPMSSVLPGASSLRRAVQAGDAEVGLDWSTHFSKCVLKRAAPAVGPAVGDQALPGEELEPAAAGQRLVERLAQADAGPRC